MTTQRKREREKKKKSRRRRTMTNWSWSQIRDLGIAGSNLGKRKKVNGEGEGGRKVDGVFNVSSVSSFLFSEH